MSLLQSSCPIPIIDPTKSTFPRLIRETEFYQLAWKEMQPYILETIISLTGQHGYTKIKSNGHHVLISEDSKVRISLPLDIARTDSLDFEDISEYSISFRTIHLPDHPIKELVDIAAIIQCFVPGRFLLGKVAFDTGLPDEGWLATNEALIRDVMGDSYFRHLWEAATRVQI